MMIKKKIKDTARKNVARSSVIMMILLPCSQKKLRIRRSESTSMTMPTDIIKTPIDAPQ
jgi:hypothetical protein